MPRNRAASPQMRHHLSGQAAVCINGKDYYLGKWGSPESSARHAYLIAEYKRHGLTLPSGFSLSDIEPSVQVFLAKAGPVTVHLEETPIKVGQLAEAYRDYVETRYNKPSQESDRQRRRKLIEELIERDGELDVDKFGPVKLMEYRQRFLKDKRKSRSYINRLVNEYLRMFKWGVSRELVEESTYRRLTTIEPLRYGDGRENERRRPVAIEVVRETAKELSPIVKAMVRVQVATGMRPNEVCMIRPADIDRSGPEWLYRPVEHKNMHRGKARVIPIVGDAKEALIEYMNRAPESFCFSPKEADAWFRAKLRSERTGNGSRKPVKGTQNIGDRYTPETYRSAINRAAKRAEVEHWFPYQLRHLNLTEVRHALGVEHAQALGGHSRADMTQHYAQVSIEKAIEAAKAAPKL